MLLMYDNIDIHWESDVNWLQLHPPEHYTDDDVDENGDVITDANRDFVEDDLYNTNFNCHATEVAVEYEDGYDEFYKDLVINYVTRLFNKELKWPKPIGTNAYQKLLMKAKNTLRNRNIIS